LAASRPSSPPPMTTAFLFVVLFAFLIIGMPIAMSLGLASILTIMLFANDSLASLALKFFQTAELYTLLAIPFFVLAGAFMTTGGVARRMIDFAVACTGHMYGGLAIASVFACMLFAAVSGSSPATVVAVGSIVIAGMVKAGYTQSFAAGVVCNAGTLGILIPPSLVMVVYAAATESSVGRLFMAGVIPGILLSAMLATAIYISARVRKIPRQPRAPMREVLRTGREALWGLLLIVIVLMVAPLAAYLPNAAMAGILFLVAWGLIDFHHIKKVYQASNSDFAVLAVTFVATLTLELEFAILLGVILSLVIYLSRTSRPRVVARVPNPKDPKRALVTDSRLPECPQLKIVRIDGSLFFGAVSHVAETLRGFRQQNPEQKFVLVVAAGINFIDVAGAELLAQEAKNYRNMGGRLFFYQMKEGRCGPCPEEIHTGWHQSL